MKKRVAFLLVLVLLGLGWASTVTVGESEYVILERFGDPHRVIAEPGLHLKWPAPIDTTVRIDRRVRILDPKPAEYLTADKKNVLVSSYLVWSVKDPVKFRVSLTDDRGADARLTDIMLSELGSVLGQHDLSDLVSDQPVPGGMDLEKVMDRLTKNTSARADASFGVKILAFRIRRLSFPNQNMQAVFDRMRAERERIAKQYRSQGKEEAAKIESEARLQEANLLAAAKQTAEETRGEADAEATKIYAAAFGKDPDFYRFLRSLEAYQEIVGSNSTLVIPSDSELLDVMRHPERYIPDKTPKNPGTATK